MVTKETFEALYLKWVSYNVDETGSRYEWAARYIFGLVTYDSELDELFVKYIIATCKCLIERRTYELCADQTRYIWYIACLQLLNNKGWIEWGTSIRGSWFLYSGGEPLYDLDDTRIKFSYYNMQALIDFLSEQED